MTKEETPEQLGARLFKEGKGLWHFWNDAPDTSKETFNRMLVGYQSEQDKCKGEPMASVSGYFEGQGVVLSINTNRISNAGTSRYTTPPKRTWVGLTNEERSKIWGELPQTLNPERDACVFAETIEAYLKERNNG